MLPILYQGLDLTLYSYPLMMGLGWGLAYQIYFSLVPQEFLRRHSLALFWGIFLFAWLGAKLLFYLTVPSEISKDILMQASFWSGGGFVFYGGFIGALIFLVMYKAIGFPLSISLLWPMLPALCIGHGVGRLGCFLAGCCYGSPTTWFWGVHLHGANRHPAQIIEAVLLLVLGVGLLKSTAKKITLIYVYLISYGLIRLVVEGLRGDQVRGQWGPLTPSQWISGLLLISGAFMMLRSRNIRELEINQP